MQTINTQNNLKNIAVLFDADNANPQHIGSLLKYLQQYGNIHTRRAYANWRKLKTFDQWNELALTFNIDQRQLASTRFGKNAADIKLVVEGMDMVFTQQVNCVCIVSDDSDYSEFLLYCRSHNVFTIVAGGKKASLNLVKSCDEFIDERTLPNEHPTVHINSFANETTIAPPAPKEEIQRRPREMKKLDKKILKKLRTRVKRKKI